MKKNNAYLFFVWMIIFCHLVLTDLLKIHPLCTHLFNYLLKVNKYTHFVPTHLFIYLLKV